MISQFKIYLKSTLFYIPLLLLVLIFQLLLGHISSIALNEEKPKLEIAISVDSEGEITDKYVEALESLEDLKVVNVGPNADKEKVFRNNSLQGLAIIPEDFEDSILNGLPDAVYLIPAPGISDTSLVEEFLGTEIIVIRSSLMFDEAITNYPNAIDEKQDQYSQGSLITVKYSGPPIESKPMAAPPAFGVPALFLLLAFLHAAQVVPGRDINRMIISGRTSILRGVFSSQVALLIVWLVMIAAYILGMLIIYKVSIDIATCVSLIGVAFYSITLGGFFAIIGKRRIAVFVFLPLLLLNMTVGGGLWAVGVQSPIFAPILPVASVVLSSAGYHSFTIVVYSMIIVFLIAQVFASKYRKTSLSIDSLYKMKM